MINGIHHIAISTSNFEQIIAFYCNVIGAEFVSKGGWDKGNKSFDQAVGLKDSSAQQAMLRLNNVYIEIFEYYTPKPKSKDSLYPPNDHGYTHICLDVTDIHSEYERLVAAGMKFNAPPGDFVDGAVRATYGRDPDGNIIEIQEIMSKDFPFYLNTGN
ncbi:VOC family protein [Ancylomarina sp. 16SWW S1-10-2]|uniref:VOC family protein n=1 Tax=Ancylomarina sp. 16SWW S1-10-2 TaxID=2499681 RepID=UPI0012AE1B25|nr:VOC family protein [Ancylomarina sp. 16SWW S1-10-2]MRT92416.1 VOC family protein [Ancylomarina sp. 16SWW S1-10-2]